MGVFFWIAVLLFQTFDGQIYGSSIDIDTESNAKAGTKQYPPFGRAMRAEFFHAPNFVSLDHGAYGGYPREVQRALHAFQNRAESNLDLWIRREAQFELDNVRSHLAEVVSAEAEDIVMIPNTTSGMNAIFRSIMFQLGDRILHISTIYGSMLSIINFMSDYTNGNVTAVQFNLTYPISNEELLVNFENFLNEHHNETNPIRMALIDHITSVPGVIMPIERIIPMLKQRNIIALIDGAHAIGQIPINITALAPDYYITNCHKWMYAARGCAMMFVDKKHQGTIHPAHINSGYRNPSNFQQEFFWTGTMDYSPYMTVPAALEFRRQVGGEAAIQEYNHNLARQGGQYLATQFGTRVLQEENQMANMVDVQLPIADPDNELLNGDFWIDTLLTQYTVYASPYKHNGQWWIRCSVQIYNDMDDFQTAAIAFIDICNKVNTNSTVPLSKA